MAMVSSALRLSLSQLAWSIPMISPSRRPLPMSIRLCSTSTSTSTPTVQLLVLSCFLVVSSSRAPVDWPHCLLHTLKVKEPSPSSLPPTHLARSAVSLDRWLSQQHKQQDHHNVRALFLHCLLNQQPDPTAIDTQTVLYTLNLLHKHATTPGPSSSLAVPSPADYLHTHILPHLTHVLLSTPSSSVPAAHSAATLRRLLNHPLVAASPSPDLLLTRLHLLLDRLATPPSPGLLYNFPLPAWDLFSAHHINALWTLITPPVPLRARTQQPSSDSVTRRASFPSPALLTSLVSRVPLANWNTTTWILAAHCPYLNPVDVARVYLGQTHVASGVRAVATFMDWVHAPDTRPPARAGSGALVRALNPLVRKRNLLVVTVLLERLVSTSPGGARSGAGGGEAPNFAMADLLLDVARGLDWDTRFLNAVLEGYAASGQWAKARHVFEDLIQVPDVYTLRVMLKYYAHTPRDVGRVVKEVSKRARQGGREEGVEVGVWGGYWLVRSALEGGVEGDWSEPPSDVKRAGGVAHVEEDKDSTGLPASVRSHATGGSGGGNWAMAHAILTSLLSSTPASVLPVTCHVLLRAYAQRGQITKVDRLVREMRAAGKMHRETSGLVMMAYVKHMQGWLRPRYTSGWQVEVVRERGFEDVWRVFAEHVREVRAARRASAGERQMDGDKGDAGQVSPAAVHWLLVSHPPNVRAAARTLAVLDSMHVVLDESHLRHLWRLAYRLTTRGKVRASVQEVHARFVAQVRGQFGADPEKVAEWEAWVQGYLETRRVWVNAVGQGEGEGGGDVVRWLREQLID